MKIIILLALWSASSWVLAGAALRPSRDYWLWTDGGVGLSLTSRVPPARLGYAVLRLDPKAAALALLPPKTQYAPLGSSLDPHLVLVPIDHMEQLDTLAPIAHEFADACGSIDFMPLHYRLAETLSFAAPHYASTAAFSDMPNLLAEVSLPKIDEAIAKVLSIPNRFHSDPIGKTASTVVAELWRSQVKAESPWAISEIAHERTTQKSVVARLPGKSAETIIVGAHLDSIARSGGRLSSTAPGADDDASGIAVLTELLRIMDSRGLTFERSIELHGYAAEEVGLIGSRELALQYHSSGRSVAGVLQIDMAYFSAAADAGVIHLLEDYTSRDLRRSAIDWIRRYIGPYYKLGRLPTGSASDHKSWWEQGYPTLFPFENPLQHNPYIHSEQDTPQFFDKGLLIQRIAQLGLLFLTYQGGLEQFAASYQEQAAGLVPKDLPNDLYLATEGVSGASEINFWVSAPAAAATLEFCPINSAADQHCSAERLTLDRASSLEGRRVFSSLDSFALAGGQRWRITAYDALDKPIALRQIEFLGSE